MTIHWYRVPAMKMPELLANYEKENWEWCIIWIINYYNVLGTTLCASCNTSKDKARIIIPKIYNAWKESQQQPQKSEKEA